jgi:hypothetical protein
LEVNSMKLLATISLLILGLLLHELYLERIHSKITTQFGVEVSKGDLYHYMFVFQGSTFNALVIGSWILFFIASACYFFIENYVSNYPQIASSVFGFMLFGFAVGLIAISIISIIIFIYPKIYIYIRPV